jgi:phage host-nuclease inhibitor protein Gam
MAAGSIVIDLLMRTGAFITDTDRASKQLKKLQRDLTQGAKEISAGFANMARGAASALSTLAGGLGPIGAALTGGGIIAGITNFIGKLDDLDEAAQNIGTTAVALSELQAAARVSGVGADELQAALTRLNVKASEGSQAFKAMGINVKDANGNIKASDTLLAEVADKFKGYEDGARKTALAVELFDKAGARLIAYLNQGGDALRANTGLTDEAVKQAIKFQQEMDKLALSFEQFTNKAGPEVLKFLARLIEEFSAAITAAGGFGGALRLLAKQSEETLKDPGKKIGELSSELKRLERRASGVSPALGKQLFGPRMEEIKKELGFLKELQRNRALANAGDNYSNEGRSRTGNTKTQAPDSKDPSAELKKRLDGELKAIRDFAEQQRTAFEFSNKYLEGVYADGLVTLEDFYKSKAQVREAGLQAELAALDKEIAALRSYAAKAPKEEDRVDANNKIAEAIQKRTAVNLKAAQENVLAGQQEGKAIESLRDSYDGLRVKVLELFGQDVAAQQITNAKAARDAAKIIAQAGGDPKIAEDLKRGLALTQQLSEQQREYARFVERTGNAEEDAIRRAEAAGKSELDTLRDIREVRRGALVEMKSLADKAADLAKQLGTPEAKDFADRLAAGLKRAGAEVDVLALKFKGVAQEIGDAIAGNFERALLEGGKLRDLLRSIEQDILRIVTRELVTKPLGDFISKSLQGVGGGGGGLIGDIGGALAGLLGFKADGGPVSANAPYIVGERGPELFVPKSSGTIVPNNRMGGNVVNINVNGGQVSRDTLQQIGAATMRGMTLASARNN